MVKYWVCKTKNKRSFTADIPIFATVPLYDRTNAVINPLIAPRKACMCSYNWFFGVSLLDIQNNGNSAEITEKLTTFELLSLKLPD